MSAARAKTVFSLNVSPKNLAMPITTVGEVLLSGHC